MTSSVNCLNFYVFGPVILVLSFAYKRDYHGVLYVIISFYY